MRKRCKSCCNSGEMCLMGMRDFEKLNDLLSIVSFMASFLFREGSLFLESCGQ